MSASRARLCSHWSPFSHAISTEAYVWTLGTAPTRSDMPISGTVMRSSSRTESSQCDDSLRPFAQMRMALL
eukprot:15263189-Heterocapsa_arctica.AAC.1